MQQGGAERLLHFGPKKTQHLTLSMQSTSNDKDFIYNATLTPAPQSELMFESEESGPVETPQRWDPVGVHETACPYFVFGAPEKGVAHPPISIFHFHDTTPNAPLKQNARIADCDGLAADGRNLPAFLLFLKDHHPRAFAEIESAIRRVAPFFGHFILKPDPRAPEYVRLRWHHLGSDDYFDVSDLSDGTLRFIALATLLLQPDPPPVTVIDEPELGLHPFALHLLAGIMDSVKERTQIVCATQSVTFVNQFSWQDIIVAETPGGMTGGGTQLRRLSEDEVTAWLDDFAMGELWEKNVIGGRP